MQVQVLHLFFLWWRKEMPQAATIDTQETSLLINLEGMTVMNAVMLFGCLCWLQTWNRWNRKRRKPERKPTERQKENTWKKRSKPMECYKEKKWQEQSEMTVRGEWRRDRRQTPALTYTFTQSRTWPTSPPSLEWDEWCRPASAMGKFFGDKTGFPMKTLFLVSLGQRKSAGPLQSLAELGRGRVDPLSSTASWLGIGDSCCW